MVYPISNPVVSDYKTFHKFPAAVQPISRGLRVNVIVHKGIVSYKDKEVSNAYGIISSTYCTALSCV